MSEPVLQARPRGARSRSRILAAARDLVLAVGYEGVTMEAIAATAGVGKQTVYRWWPSKASVVGDAFLEDWTAAPYLLISAPVGDGFAWAHDHVDFFDSPGGGLVVRALTSAAAEDERVARSLDTQFTAPLLAGVIEWFADVVPDGSPDAFERRRAAADMLLGALVFRQLTRAEPISHARAELVVQLALRALSR